MDDVTKPSDNGEVVPPPPNEGITPPMVNEEPTPEVVTSDNNKKNKGDKKGKKPLVIGLIVLLIAAVAGWWFFMRDSSPTNNNTTTEVVKNDIPHINYAAFDGPVNEFYPILYQSDTAGTLNYQIFEGLVGYQNETRIEPLLAKSWTNPDDTTWVFTLKDGVKFHSGNPVTADVVKASLDSVLGNNDYSAYNSTIDKVTVTDGKVTITTKGPDPLLLNKLTRLFIYDTSLGTTGDPNAGTGPYTVKSGTTPTEDTLDLAAVEDYHGGHVYVKEVNVKVYADDDSMTADLENGKIDISSGALANTGIAKGVEKGYVKFPVEYSVFSLYAGTLKAGSPMAKLKVRQAVQLAMDQNAMLTAGDVTAAPANQLVGKTITGYNPDIPTVTRDVAKAKTLLTEAGYPNGTTINIGAGRSAQGELEAIKSQLAEAGITVKEDYAQVTSFSEFLGLVAAGRYDAWLMTNGSTLADLSDVMPMDFKMYENSDVSAMLAEANQTLDQAERLAKLQELHAKLMADLPLIPIRLRTYPYLIRSNFVLTRDLPSSDIGVLFYKVYSK